jgi:hypothetical protein
VAVSAAAGNAAAEAGTPAVVRGRLALLLVLAAYDCAASACNVQCSSALVTRKVGGQWQANTLRIHRQCSMRGQTYQAAEAHRLAGAD